MCEAAINETSSWHINTFSFSFQSTQISLSSPIASLDASPWIAADLMQQLI
jgi:hypothetical protein